MACHPPPSTTEANTAQFLPLREFDTVTNALNFSTPDYHVLGACDVYTTKAAGGDKKLYKNIESSLESQYETLVRLSASLSPPRRRASDDEQGDRNRKTRHASLGVPEIYLTRGSPFGPLSQASSRRTFAYMIATLNASHPDYDFSYTLRPDDFRKERSLKGIMHNVDSTLGNLRPRASNFGGANPYLAPPSRAPFGGMTGAEIWSPRMWDLIDKEMGLRRCEKYSYAPDDDPFDEDEGCIWSLHYLFFNKERKRVCYLYLRGFSVISHSPVSVPTYLNNAMKKQQRNSGVSVRDGAGKRAGYWLGVRAGGVDDAGDFEEDDDVTMVDEYGEYDTYDDVPGMDLDGFSNEVAEGYFSGDAEADADIEANDGFWEDGWRPVGGSVRSVGEVAGEMMEV